MLSRVILGSRLMSCRGATCTIAARQEHTLPALPYEYNALAPVVNADIMELHHKKHHATYVNNLNNAEKQLKEATDAGDIGKVIALQPALKFNGGGHINHSIFWTVMSPNGGGEPTGDLLSAINRDFGSYDNMREKLSAASIGIQGSGWGWLGYNKTTRTLAITTCANQDPLEATTGLVPLFGIDVWEHAYYLQYKNVRPDYVKAIFNVANWQNIDERYHNALINS
ncbi:superoxide dismutase [Mn], mitochondrial-like [Asterias rubens]|uniref:superoxide dismutase [Mn], mitochondrial-like n=1 Tax=Asterias rubens TaxID=7604 RepID=UPI0014557B15|nr:superoxide dismutase [Mn], mitochondrial-like [Asterias rubens]